MSHVITWPGLCREDPPLPRQPNKWHIVSSSIVYFYFTACPKESNKVLSVIDKYISFIGNWKTFWANLHTGGKN